MISSIDKNSDAGVLLFNVEVFVVAGRLKLAGGPKSADLRLFGRALSCGPCTARICGANAELRMPRLTTSAHLAGAPAVLIFIDVCLAPARVGLPRGKAAGHVRRGSLQEAAAGLWQGLGVLRRAAGRRDRPAHAGDTGG